MNIALRRPMSRQDFLDWDGHLEGRYEFDGERPVAMTGGNLGHSLIIVNLIAGLKSRLAGRPCRVLGPEAGIATTGARVRYPDAVVTCSPIPPGEKLLPSPVIVFEVVSPGSIRTDRVVKPAEYAAVPSILRYVVIESGAVEATVRSRQAGHEPFSLARLGRGDVLSLPEAGIELPLDAVYDEVLP